MFKIRLNLRIVIVITICLAGNATIFAQEEVGVEINGVIWATRNVNTPNTFVNKPADFGMFYQWNRKKAWATTIGWIPDWDTTMPGSFVWEQANDPSPEGWRIPTIEEIRTLLDTENVSEEWTNESGIKGNKFTDKITQNSIFLPDAGFINAEGIAYYIGTQGYYWSSSYVDSNRAYYFYSSGPATNVNSRLWGYSIRCVKNGCFKPKASSIVGESNVSINNNIVYKVNSVMSNTYTWKSNRGIISSGQGTNSIVISWDEVGLDSVKVFLENDCGVDSIAYNVNIQECVPLNMSKIQSSNSYTEFYVDKYEGQDPTYLWSVDKGTILSGQNTNHIKVNWPEYGNAEVSVRITNDCSVFEDNIQFIYTHLDNVIEAENVEVKIYPNPAKDKLIIDTNELTIKKLEILNLLGKKINSQWFNDKSINVLALPQGLYFLKLETDKGIITKKFVKE